MMKPALPGNTSNPPRPRWIEDEHAVVAKQLSRWRGPTELRLERSTTTTNVR